MILIELRPPKTWFNRLSSSSNIVKKKKSLHSNRFKLGHTLYIDKVGPFIIESCYPQTTLDVLSRLTENERGSVAKVKMQKIPTSIFSSATHKTVNCDRQSGPFRNGRTHIGFGTQKYSESSPYVGSGSL